MIITLLFVAALVCGIVSFVDSRINWAAAGVILLAIGLLIGRL